MGDIEKQNALALKQTIEDFDNRLNEQAVKYEELKNYVTQLEQKLNTLQSQYYTLLSKNFQGGATTKD